MRYGGIVADEAQHWKLSFSPVLAIQARLWIFWRCYQGRESDLERGPPQKWHFASIPARAINLSPTLAGASVGGTWRVASVRWRCGVARGKCQVSSGGVHVRVNVHVHVHVNVHVQVRMCMCMCM